MRFVNSIELSLILVQLWICSSNRLGAMASQRDNSHFKIAKRKSLEKTEDNWLQIAKDGFMKAYPKQYKLPKISREAIPNTSYYKTDDFHKIPVKVWTEQFLGELISAKIVRPREDSRALVRPADMLKSLISLPFRTIDHSIRLSRADFRLSQYLSPENGIKPWKMGKKWQGWLVEAKELTMI